LTERDAARFELSRRNPFKAQRGRMPWPEDNRKVFERRILGIEKQCQLLNLLDREPVCAAGQQPMARQRGRHQDRSRSDGRLSLKLKTVSAKDPAAEQV
jgi:hypothetical protein